VLRVVRVQHLDVTRTELFERVSLFHPRLPVTRQQTAKQQQHKVTYSHRRAREQFAQPVRKQAPWIYQSLSLFPGDPLPDSFLEPRGQTIVDFPLSQGSMKIFWFHGFRGGSLAAALMNFFSTILRHLIGAI